MECLKDVCGSEFARLAAGQVEQKFNQRGDFCEVSSNHGLPFGTSPKNLFARETGGWANLGKLDCRFSRFCTWPIRAWEIDFIGLRSLFGIVGIRITIQKLFRARIVATSSTRLTQTTHNTTSKTMACIASSFTGSVAALKATKIQVCIHSNRPRIWRFPSHRRLPAFG